MLLAFCAHGRPDAACGELDALRCASAGIGISAGWSAGLCCAEMKRGCSGITAADSEYYALYVHPSTHCFCGFC
jgi:hypothetical protein